MLPLLQFIEEIAKEDLSIPPADVKRMRERFGDKVHRMGHLQEDGSMLVPIDCVLEAAQSLGTQTLTEAAEILKSDESLHRGGEAFIDRVGEARERKLRETIRKFQNRNRMKRMPTSTGSKLRKWFSAWLSRLIHAAYRLEAPFPATPRAYARPSAHPGNHRGRYGAAHELLLGYLEGLDLYHPEVPEGSWCKDFGTFKLVGHGASPATLLTSNRLSFGVRI